MANYRLTMATDDVSPAQSRAARAYLEWGRRDLAGQAGVAENTVYNFETGRVRNARPETRAKIRRAIEVAGLTFAGSDLILPHAIIGG